MLKKSHIKRTTQKQPRFEIWAVFCYDKNAMEEKNIILNNLLIHYYGWNKAEQNSCTLVFLHGWRSDGSVWRPIIPALLEKTKCDIYALDLPGFGKSQTPPPSFSLDGYCEIVKAFIEKLGITEATLIGHSFGGRIAIKLASEKSSEVQPPKIKKLALIDSAGMRVEDARLEIKKLIAKIAKPFFRIPFLSRLRNPLYRAIGSEDYLATPELREVFVKIVNEDLQPLFSGISTKTLIVWGENDNITPTEAGEIMQKEIPNAELAVLKNAGHFSFLDQKEEFVKILAAFINEGYINE